MKSVFKNLTKVVAIMMVAIMTMGAFPLTVQANQDVTIIIDGRTITQNADTGFAVIIDDRTFIPLRLVSENMGIEVFWQRDGDGVITMVGHGRTVYHTVGQTTAFDTPSPEFGVTQPVATTDVPSFISDGRTFVGVRLVADAFNATPGWDGSTRTVTITTQGNDVTPPTGTDVSAAHRNAWRPTNPAFINLALSLEVLAGTEVRNGNLEGTLYTIQGIHSTAFAANGILQGQQASIHGEDGRGLIAIPATSITRLAFRNTEFHEWRRANTNAIGALADPAFIDMSGRETYAADVVLFTYYNVIGRRHTTGAPSFNGSGAMPRNEVVEIFNNLGAFQPATGPMGDLLRGIFEGVAPAWALDGWMGSRIMFANNHMTDAQVRTIVDGNINRLEAAVVMAEWLDLFNGLDSYTVRRNTVDNQAFRTQAANRFSDLNNISSYIEANVAENPMLRHNQRTGTTQMCPHDAWIILQIADLGIIEGFADGTFRPYETVTRGQFMVMLMRALEVDATRVQAR